MTYHKQLPRQELRRLQREDAKLDKKIMYSERELQERIIMKIKETIEVDSDKVRQEYANEVQMRLRKEFGWGDKRLNKLFGGVS